MFCDVVRFGLQIPDEVLAMVPDPITMVVLVFSGRVILRRGDVPDKGSQANHCESLNGPKAERTRSRQCLAAL